MMVGSEINPGTSAPLKKDVVPSVQRKRKSRPQALPSPALCCACGLCIMLAGVNITLVGAFAFTTLMPSGNPPIIIGPTLLLLAGVFFGACCACSRLPPAHGSRRSGGGGTGFMRCQGMAFEIETSEHTVQDTTAVQLSPAHSPSLSRSSGSAHAMPTDYTLFTTETNGPTLPSAAFFSSAGNDDAVKLTLPSDAT